MKTRLTFLLAALCGSTLTAQAQTADELVAKNVAARGGIERLRAIRTMTVTAKLVTPDGHGGPMTIQLMRPDLIREEMNFGPAKSVRAFDGKAGWETHADSGTVEVRPVTGGDLDSLRDEGANGIDGSLADYKEKGNKVTFEGAAVVEGRPCYKLKVVLRSGHVQYLFLDAQSFLEVHEEIVRSFNGNESIIEETIADYREEGGVLFAHRYVSGMAGRTNKSTLTFEKIEINPPLDRSLFAQPAPGKKPVKATKP